MVPADWQRQIGSLEYGSKELLDLVWFLCDLVERGMVSGEKLDRCLQVKHDTHWAEIDKIELNDEFHHGRRKVA
jgi:hypothetical protein